MRKSGYPSPCPSRSTTYAGLVPGMRGELMKLHFGVFAALIATTCALAVAPTIAAAPPAPTNVTAPITGTFTSALGTTGTLAGTFALDRIANQNGQLVALGTVTGTLTNAAGAVIGTVNEAVALPVTAN